MRKQNFKPNKKERETSFLVKENSSVFDFLLKKMGGMSKSSIKGLLQRGQISVNDQIVKRGETVLSNGDLIKISFSQSTNGLKHTKLSIIYEDDAIIVVNKGAGLLSVATDKNEETTAFRILLNHLKKQDKNNRLYIVHRIDRETSGVLLFAKSKEIQMQLQHNWHRQVFEKIYLALVEGCVEKEEDTIHTWLVEEPKSKKVYSFDYDNGGLESTTIYNVEKRFKQNTLLRVSLKTGRKNQIRVHLQSIGHPIVGDKKYGSTTSPINRIGLHAYSISLWHPIIGKNVRFEAPLPEAFNKIK
ncbi:MAG: RluA family pseudouridine synthase [Paludibacteraceae bacterium]|nr:RluA family pseudouridine synthase [Paludibacteraceae bacterium]